MKKQIFILTTFVCLMANATECFLEYTAKKHTIWISTPHGYSVAPQKLQKAYDQNRSKVGLSNKNKFVLWVRDGSIDLTGTQGDTFLVEKIEGTSDRKMSVQEFDKYVKFEIKRLCEESGDCEIIGEGRKWFVIEGFGEKPRPGCKNEKCITYCQTGYFIMDEHVYACCVALHDPTPTLREESHRLVKEWLQLQTGDAELQNKSSSNFSPKTFTKKANGPTEFLGIRLGDKVPKQKQQFETNQQYLGFYFTPKEMFLDYNQYAFHATLKTRTISSVSAGKICESKEDAMALAQQAKQWIEDRYGLKGEVFPNTPNNRIIWMYCFNADSKENFRFFLVEINSATGMWLSLITYYDTELSELQVAESKLVDYKSISNPGLMMTSTKDSEDMSTGECNGVEVIKRGIERAQEVNKKEEEKKFKKMSNLTSVGTMDLKGKSILGDSVYQSLFVEPVVAARTLGNEKADGVDVQVKYPISFECTEGNAAHTIYDISKFFPEGDVRLGMNLAMWAIPEAQLRSFQKFNPNEEITGEFVDLIEQMTGQRGELIGCGISKLSDRNILWFTVAASQERVGVKSSVIMRTFLIPATTGHCISCNFSVGVVGDEMPIDDFERFIPVGLKYINSLIFMDKSQIKRGSSIDAEKCGTGWFVTGEHIVTCWHVIEGCSSISYVDKSGKSNRLTLIGKDEFSDLALLKVVDQSAKCKSPLSLAAVKVNVADKVFTVGYPLIEYMGKTPKYSEGVVNALSGYGDDETLLQMSAPVQQGNSGGALLNESCEVVGVVQSGLNTSNVRDEGIGSAQNVNYAAKAYLVRRLVKKCGIRLPMATEKKAPVKDKYKKACDATVFIYAK